MVKTRAQISEEERKRLKIKSLLQLHKTPNQISKDIGVVRQTVSILKKGEGFRGKKDLAGEIF